VAMVASAGRRKHRQFQRLEQTLNAARTVTMDGFSLACVAPHSKVE
jgi:hypothetical protein